MCYTIYCAEQLNDGAKALHIVSGGKTIMEIIKNGDVNAAEEEAALKMLSEKHGGENIYKVELTPNGEYVDVKYYTRSPLALLKRSSVPTR